MRVGGRPPSFFFDEMKATSPRLEELKAKLADLKRRWPAHTPPPALMQQLDELEEEIAAEKARIQQEQGDAQKNGLD